MATNEILKFGETASNILSQADYDVDPQRDNGVSGVARSNLQNKFQRQVSTIAAGIAQFIADYNSADDDVTDTLDASALEALFLDAISNAPITTQPQFDNSQKAATTAFVQRALGSLSSSASYSVNTNLTDADIGKTILPTSGGLGFGLPPVSGLPNGSQIRFNGNSHGCAISRQGSDVINNGTAGSVSTISILEYDFVEFTVIGGIWTVTGGEGHQRVSSSYGSPTMVKAWVNFSGYTPETILDSYNIASVTRYGIGHYYIQFDTPMINENYVYFGTCGGQNGVSDTGANNIISGGKFNPPNPAVKTVNGFDVYCSEIGTGETLEDCGSINIVVFGS